MKPLIERKITYVIIDENIITRYPFKEYLQPGRFYILKATEENKTMGKAEEIIDEIIKMDSKKNTLLIAIGGGIVQDLTCFIASILYRGINWVLVPTTLLAQTDSCIGSKSSINYKHFKNLVGTFYPPSEIIVSPTFLDSLTMKDYCSGLGEIVKIQLMISQDNYRDFSDNVEKLLNRDYNLLMTFVKRTLAYKKGLIEEDEFDAGIRNILNYGHTFGHAIETSTEYFVPHGQAVSIGILIANKISEKMGLITKQYEEEVFSTIVKIISPEFKKSQILETERIVSSMKMDKKFTGTHNCILLGEGGARMHKNVEETLIKDAMDEVRTQLEKQ